MNILLDFDKTLTKRDTLFGFFVFIALTSKKSRTFLIPVYALGMVISYFGLLSNSNLKMLGVRFFVKGMKEKELSELSQLYSQKIIFNDLYRSVLENSDKFNAVVVSTASLNCYVKYCFPDRYMVIGSRLNIENGLVTGLASNNFGNCKLEGLKSLNLRFDLSISDSSKDECFKEVSDLFIIRRVD